LGVTDGVPDGVPVGVPVPEGSVAEGEADDVGDIRIAVKYAACGIEHEGIPCFENDI